MQVCNIVAILQNKLITRGAEQCSVTKLILQNLFPF